MSTQPSGWDLGTYQMHAGHRLLVATLGRVALLSPPILTVQRARHKLDRDLGRRLLRGVKVGGCRTVLVHVEWHGLVEAHLAHVLRGRQPQHRAPFSHLLTGELGLEQSELLSNDKLPEKIVLFGEADGELT